jgi:hypothetical protein
MTELEIPILPKEPEPDMPVREVVIRLTGTDPEAPAQGTLSIVNGGEKSWRWAVEKCGALEWRIGC